MQIAVRAAHVHVKIRRVDLGVVCIHEDTGADLHLVLFVRVARPCCGLVALLDLKVGDKQAIPGGKAAVEVERIAGTRRIIRKRMAECLPAPRQMLRSQAARLKPHVHVQPISLVGNVRLDLPRVRPAVYQRRRIARMPIHIRAAAARRKINADIARRAEWRIGKPRIGIRAARRRTAEGHGLIGV